MNNKFFEVSVRIIVLTWVFFVLINFLWYFWNSKDSVEAASVNKENFESNDIQVMWNVWVALSTNIWTRASEIANSSVSVYKDVFTIWQIIADNRTVQDELITKNMIILNEYLNVLKTNVRWLLNSSNDRVSFLNAFIDQLEYRYKVWVENINTLNLQKSQLLASYNASVQKVENIKQDLAVNYWDLKTTETLENIDWYLETLQEQTYARTYLVFVNKFIDSYNILNNYNKVLLDTLINNKEALIKNTQVVIPDSWSSLLDKLDLIYTENEWKTLE